ncbi:hypothetical protein JET14_06170 [Martelella lutilitoris]|uniref:Uncharacterized protein n=1 Tax=Martelella lutilitoris TaxID=2583532 RepID=A0A7T7HM40_9HYPH|nr:hypothetical protein [Martelella lutilitoris]QQM31751.1 hypothetical protein JET14_06170 [Martelella lutilitoris]
MTVSGDVIFCDDIRKEDNGKAILIGVYTGALVLEQLPVDILLSAWIRVSGLDKGKHDVSVEFHSPGGKTFSIGAEAHIVDPENVDSIMLSGFPLHIGETGKISCKFKVSNEEYELGNLPVTVADEPKLDD